MKRCIIVVFITTLFLMKGCSAAESNESIQLHISAAISLTDALKEIKQLYEENNNVNLTFNFAGSGTLAQQIEQGAPIDVFISASEDWMDRLDEKSLLISATRKNITSNRLVLIGHADTSLALDSFHGLTQDAISNIAIGNPESVPAGKYAKEALKTFGIWDDLQDKFVYAKDVRQVLAYVESGDADLGFVYESDCLAFENIAILTTAPSDLHDSIIYPGAVIRETKYEQEAKKFLDFLSTEKAQNILYKHGFHH